MRVGPTTPIVPTVASPALNGAVTIEASHSPVVGCSAPIVTRTSSAGSTSWSTRSISCSRSSVSNSRRSVSRRHACASSARFATPPTTTCARGRPARDPQDVGRDQQ